MYKIVVLLGRDAMNGRYFVGTTISSSSNLAFGRVSILRHRVSLAIGIEPVRTKEVRMVLTPPFYMDFEHAWKLWRRMSLTPMLAKHPVIETVFGISGLRTMHWVDESIIYIPVTIKHEVNKGSLTRYLEILQEKIHSVQGVRAVNYVPQDFLPYITCAGVKGARGDEKIQAAVNGSWEEKMGVRFVVSHPTLYAYYKEGWRELDKDPVKEWEYES